MATVIGVFDSHDAAERCVRQMRAKGFTDNEISLVAKGQGGQGGQGRARGRGQDMETGGEMGGQNIADGAAWGGALGAAGGMLAGAGMLAIPGVGPILAAGPLAATLSGAAAGGLAGGLLDMGVTEEQGRQYENELRQGRVLAVVEASDQRADDAARLMEESNALDVQIHGEG